MPGRFWDKQNLGIKQHLDVLCYERHLLWGRIQNRCPDDSSELRTCDDLFFEERQVSNVELLLNLFNWKIHFLSLGLKADAVWERRGGRLLDSCGGDISRMLVRGGVWFLSAVCSAWVFKKTKQVCDVLVCCFFLSFLSTSSRSFSDWTWLLLASLKLLLLLWYVCNSLLSSWMFPWDPWIEERLCSLRLYNF